MDTQIYIVCFKMKQPVYNFTKGDDLYDQPMSSEKNRRQSDDKNDEDDDDFEFFGSGY